MRAGDVVVAGLGVLAETEEVRRLVERILPAAGASCCRSAACLYANTPDLRSGHGFKFAPALGELVAQGRRERQTSVAESGVTDSSDNRDRARQYQRRGLP